MWVREIPASQSLDASFWSLDHIQGTYTPEIYCPNDACKSLSQLFSQLPVSAPLDLKGDQGVAVCGAVGRTWMWLGEPTTVCQAPLSDAAAGSREREEKGAGKNGVSSPHGTVLRETTRSL